MHDQTRSHLVESRKAVVAAWTRAADQLDEELYTVGILTQSILFDLRSFSSPVSITQPHETDIDLRSRQPAAWMSRELLQARSKNRRLDYALRMHEVD